MACCILSKWVDLWKWDARALLSSVATTLAKVNIKRQARNCAPNTNRHSTEGSSATVSQHPLSKLTANQAFPLQHFIKLTR